MKERTLFKNVRSVKILVAVIMAVAVALSAFVAINFSGKAIAADADSIAVWDGTAPATDRFAGGTGTKDDPYCISNGQELYLLALAINQPNTLDDGQKLKIAVANGKEDIAELNGVDVYYKLTADIYLNDTTDWKNWDADTVGLNTWLPIGINDSSEDGKSFRANFNGNDFVVKGIYISSNSSNLGLFGSARGATIENLGVEEGYIKGYSNVGGLFGSMSFHHKPDTDGIVKNCYNAVNVFATSNAGGITGNTGASVEYTDCYNTGDITVSGVNAGGITGYTYNDTMRRVYNSGKITAGSAENSGVFISYAGGLVGYSSSSLGLYDSYNEGNVTGDGSHVGGLIGYTGSFCRMENNYNTGAVSGVNNVGGIAGRSNGTMGNSYNSGNITGSGSAVGGLVGLSVIGGSYQIDIFNSYNLGAVSASGVDSDYVGGIVGSIENKGAKAHSIINTYNAGAVTSANASANIGAIAGYLNNVAVNDETGETSYKEVKFTNVYYLSGTASNMLGGKADINETGSVATSVVVFNSSKELASSVTISDRTTSDLHFALNLWVSSNKNFSMFGYISLATQYFISDSSGVYKHTPDTYYLVDFIDGESIAKELFVVRGGTVAKPDTDPTSADPDKVFAGWVTSGGTKWTEELKINYSTTFRSAFLSELTVAFNANGGTSVDSQTVLENEKAEESADPTRSGYTFEGWYLGNDLFDFDTAITEDITLDAKWSVTVAFNANGGTSVDSQTVLENEKAEEPADPTRSGYTFEGWYLGNDLFDFDTAITEAVTLDAKWSVTVAFNANGGTSVDSQTVLENEKAEEPADPTRSGYTFEGWYLGNDLFDFDTAITEAVTLDAKWKLDAPIVEIKKNVKDDGTIELVAEIENETSDINYDYQWQVKDGDSFVDVVDESLPIIKLDKKADAGVYVCVVTASDGVTTAESTKTTDKAVTITETELPSDGGMPAGIIALIVILSLLGLLIILFIVLYIIWKKKDKRPIGFLVPVFRIINNLLFKTKLNNIELEENNYSDNVQ